MSVSGKPKAHACAHKCHLSTEFATAEIALLSEASQSQDQEVTNGADDPMLGMDGSQVQQDLTLDDDDDDVDEETQKILR